MRCSVAILGLALVIGALAMGAVWAAENITPAPVTQDPTPAPASPTVTTPNIAFAVTTDREGYRPGETVRFVMTARNEGAETAVLEFNTGQRFDLEMIDPQGEVVWTWSDGRFFTMELGTLQIAPGATETFDATWDQRDAAEAQVAPARYTVRAWLTATNAEASATAEFDIHMPAQLG